MTDTISQVFDLPRQLDDRVRVSRPVRAMFHVASREEVNRWLLGKSGEAMTDQDLVLKYVVEVRDLSHDMNPACPLRTSRATSGLRQCSPPSSSATSKGEDQLHEPEGIGRSAWMLRDGSERFNSQNARCPRVHMALRRPGRQY